MKSFPLNTDCRFKIKELHFLKCLDFLVAHKLNLQFKVSKYAGSIRYPSNYWSRYNHFKNTMYIDTEHKN